MTEPDLDDGQRAYLDKVRGSGMTVGDGVDGPENAGTFDPSALFAPLTVGRTTIANRIVMAPMTRNMSPGGVPGPDVAAYYRQRATGGAGLIVTEGTYVPQSGAGFSPNVPRFHGDDALAGWRRVVEGVHAAGGRIMPQLWHVGLMPLPGDVADASRVVSPSGIAAPDVTTHEPSPDRIVEDTVVAFGDAAASALAIGCDGIQIHGAHGYLVDQFLWDATNRRAGAYGGRDLVARSRFAIDIVRECRRRTARDFPISFRFSQWKQQDFTARLAATPADLERFLLPLADAGVDIFDCSTRRFWEAEFDGSDMNLAGWTKRITGRVTSTVGSISLNTDLFSSFATETHVTNNMARLLTMMDRGDFDLVSVGRALIADPDWGVKIRRGDLRTLRPYKVDSLGTL